MSDFPLPQAHIAGAGNFLANGDSSNGVSERDGLGSDASLGGALLTPIAWIKKDHSLAGAAAQAQELRTEASHTTEGPNGAGRVETVSVTINGMSGASKQATHEEDEPAMTHEEALRAEGAVTQGELLRQEQEAGVVPAGHETLRRNLIGGGAVAVGRESMAVNEAAEQQQRPEEHPSARGPDVIGPEDMGPQSYALGGRPLDMDAAVGRAKSPSATEKTAHEDAPTVTANPLQELQSEGGEETAEPSDITETPSQEAQPQEDQSDSVMPDAS